MPLFFILMHRFSSSTVFIRVGPSVRMENDEMGFQEAIPTSVREGLALACWGLRRLCCEARPLFVPSNLRCFLSPLLIHASLKGSCCCFLSPIPTLIGRCKFYFYFQGGGKVCLCVFLRTPNRPPQKVECEGTPVPTQGRLPVGSFEDAVEQLEAGKAMPAKDSLPGWDRIAWGFIV